MLKKDRKERDQLEFVSIEALVPKDHLLRKIDAAVDFRTCPHRIKIYAKACGYAK